MTHDSDNLLRVSGVTGFTYREIAKEEEQDAAASRWPLLVAVNRALAAGARLRARLLAEQPVAQYIAPVAFPEVG